MAKLHVSYIILEGMGVNPVPFIFLSRNNYINNNVTIHIIANIIDKSICTKLYFIIYLIFIYIIWQNMQIIYNIIIIKYGRVVNMKKIISTMLLGLMLLFPIINLSTHTPWPVYQALKLIKLNDLDYNLNMA